MFLKKTFPALLLGLVFVTGCEALTGDRDNNNDDTLPPRNNRNDRISKRDRGGNDGTVMKYPADFDYGIPTGAHLAREIDQDGSLSYKAAHDGKLYLFDADTKRVIWSGSVRDNDRFSIDTRDNRVSLNNDQNVLRNNRELNPDHRYRLYFVPDSVNDTNSTNDRSSDRVQ